MISKYYKTLCAALALCGSMSAAAQDNVNTVMGRVVDAATGSPLVGVMVTAYGDARYTAMTNEQGEYELKVPEYTRSVYMTVDGYGTQQRAIADGRADVALYHEAFKSSYTKNTEAIISSLATDFANTAEVSVDPLMQQQLGADIRMISRSGLIGSGNMMLMHGINSLNANAQPLVVIDGVILDM